MDNAPHHAQPEADPNWDEEEFVPRKRPFGVTLFLWMVLSLSAWGLLRLLGALSWWDVLSQYRARLGPLYLSITGAGWAVAGGALFWGTFAKKRWARYAVPVYIVVWFIEYWIERIFFEASRANLLFMILFSAIILVITLIISLKRNTQYFFDEKRGT